MSGSSAPAAPNYSGIADAQQKQAEYQYEIAKEQLAFAKQTYAEHQPFVKKVENNLTDAMDENLRTAKQDRARYEQIYQPLEDKQVNDARDWDSEGNLERNRTRVAAKVGAAFDAADANATRQLESFGVNPADTKFAALNRGAKLGRAAAVAGAQNQSDVDTKMQAVALRGNAINTGKGYPAQVAAQYGTATGTGTAGVGTANSTFSAYAPSLANPVAWQGLGNQSMSNASSTMIGGYNSAVGGYAAGQQSSSGWGSALGLAAGIATKFLAKGGRVGGRTAVDMSGGGAGGGDMEPDPNDPMEAAEGESEYMVPPEASVDPGAGGDTVPAMLKPNEFVMPDRAVRYYGEKFLIGLIQKADKAMGVEEQPVGPEQHTVPRAVMQHPTYASPGARRSAIQRAA